MHADADILELCQLFEEGLTIEPPPPDADLIDSGLLDSLAVVQLVVQIEERFSVRVPVEELTLEDLRSLRTIAALIARLRSTRPRG